MTYNRIFLLFLFTCAMSSIIAQNITINGYAPAYKDQEVTLFTYADYVSNAEIPVATQVVNDSGFFHFDFQSTDIKRILLRGAKQRADMYVEPDRNYTIFFPARDSVRFPNPNIEQKVDLEFAVTDTTEINALIIAYNERFDKFWSENYPYFVQKRSRAKLDSFELQMQKDYSSLNKPYFNSFITYTIAGLDLNTFQSKGDLAAKYLLRRPVLYDNYEYMSFFNAFFDHYLQSYMQAKNGQALIAQINEQSSYEGCMRILAGDKYLKNDTLRELVLIKGLGELYYVPDFKRENVVDILGRIASGSKLTMHQAIAAHVINSFSKLKPGATAPEFSLLDQKGKEVHLSDFKGKFVYLDFWATWCVPCLQEMKLIPDLKKRYGDKIVFVSISLDDDTLQLKKFLAKNPKYDWVILHYGINKRVKENYEIKSVPSYFLVNPFGNFIQSPALRPSQSIESSFWEISKKKRMVNKQ